MLLNSSNEPRAAAMIGETYTPLDNSSGRLGIGDDDTAADQAQTDLQAASNKTYLQQDPGYPARSGAVLTFQVTAEESEANYAWKEFLLCDGSPGVAWARFVQVLNGGSAKVIGDVWTLQITATVDRNDVAN
jgi:hypothetical protein